MNKKYVLFTLLILLLFFLYFLIVPKEKVNKQSRNNNNINNLANLTKPPNTVITNSNNDYGENSISPTKENQEIINATEEIFPTKGFNLNIENSNTNNNSIINNSNINNNSNTISPTNINSFPTNLLFDTPSITKTISSITNIPSNITSITKILTPKITSNYSNSIINPIINHQSTISPTIYKGDNPSISNSIYPSENQIITPEYTNKPSTNISITTTITDSFKPTESIKFRSGYIAKYVSIKEEIVVPTYKSNKGTIIFWEFEHDNTSSYDYITSKTSFSKEYIIERLNAGDSMFDLFIKSCNQLGESYKTCNYRTNTYKYFDQLMIVGFVDELNKKTYWNEDDYINIEFVHENEIVLYE